MRWLILSSLAIVALTSCNSGAEKKDNTFWEKKVLEAINTEKGPEGGGANYANKVEILKTDTKENGSIRVSFLWWGEFRNGSVQGFEPRKVNGEAMTYEFDNNGKRVMDY